MKEQSIHTCASVDRHWEGAEWGLVGVKFSLLCWEKSKSFLQCYPLS